MLDPVKVAAAIECLVAGETTQATAEFCQVDVSTIKRWKNDPEFKEQLTARQAEVIAEFKGRIGRLAAKAFTAFEQCLDGAVGETAKHKSAELVLRTIGLLGEKAEVDTKTDDTVELIKIGLNDKDEVVELESDGQRDVPEVRSDDGNKS